MTGRTFVVTVSESPARVVIEDVRSRERIVAADVSDVGAKIARWMSRAQTGAAADRIPYAARRAASE